ncbi:LysR substrate-binding domain-containing protein [Aquabacterium sp. J223]|uniref:LysR substrate-binding domain-containing protein n=1 Tax=Aquabacterium sp. J223 TaxID=2898431 RepID=UPI0021ADEBC7|nr:LysR substrate-binding domain-containing protein [Aquabacterium sp. J223]UUX95480.1 LysR substrate-binding domain-containing protein [Aquabacterium sp. J223]
MTMHDEAGDAVRRLDLNLLRLFDAVYQTRHVGRAAEQLGMTQPAASQALTRLRLRVGDPLFARAAGGMQPSARAHRMAPTVAAALALMAQALGDGEAFDPQRSGRTFRVHLSDIGEARFLPSLMAALHRHAPAVRLECQALPQARIAAALDDGELDFAFGFLPGVRDTRRALLLHDRYVVLLREGHALARRRRARPALSDLAPLEFAAVRSHSETLRILQQLGLGPRLRLVASHFLALPAVVRDSDLGLLIPDEVARGIAQHGGFAIVEPRLPMGDFAVSLHWSRRHEDEPAQRFFRRLVTEQLFSGSRPAAARR